VVGDYNVLSGVRATVYGHHNVLSGAACKAYGNFNVLSGAGCASYGDDCSISGAGCVSEGLRCRVTGMACSNRNVAVDPRAHPPPAIPTRDAPKRIEAETEHPGSNVPSAPTEAATVHPSAPKMTRDTATTRPEHKRSREPVYVDVTEKKKPKRDTEHKKTHAEPGSKDK
jgi:hypothetical protein